MLYALISPEDTVDRIQSNVDPEVQTKPGWRWLPVVDEERPPYNPELQNAIGTVTVQETQVLRGWIIVDFTPEEILSRKTSWVNSIERAVMTALFNQENRLLTLEQQPTITLEEYKIKIRDLI
jgi:hypothetical protein